MPTKKTKKSTSGSKKKAEVAEEQNPHSREDASSEVGGGGAGGLDEGKVEMAETGQVRERPNADVESRDIEANRDAEEGFRKQEERSSDESAEKLEH